jgi:hypothetical protein
VEDKMLSIWGVVLSGIGIILAIINMFLGFAMAMNDMGY